MALAEKNIYTQAGFIFFAIIIRDNIEDDEAESVVRHTYEQTLTRRKTCQHTE